MSKELTFEEKMKLLDQLTNQMEQGEMSLDESMKAYEEGMKLVKECQEYINNAKLKIEKITGSGVEEG